MKVIIAIDGSDCSLSALESVLDRPWPPEAEFMVLTVIEPPIPPYASWQKAQVPGLDAAQRELTGECQQLVDERVSLLQREFPHNTVIGKVTEGAVSDTIVKEAAGWDADFIVMGSHGRTGFKKFLLGSVAESVVSRAPCSVEIIRQPLPDISEQPKEETAEAAK